MSGNNSIKQTSVESRFDKLLPIIEQILLLQDRGLHSYLNRDIVKFQNKFERLKLLRDLPANNERFEEAYQLFSDIFDVVPMRYQNLSNISVVRAAKNSVNEVFSTQSRISYNKLTENIPPGKFNVYYQPMFYGCIPYEPKQLEVYPRPRLVAALECCKDLYHKEYPLPVQDITIGSWHIIEPFNAINLCFDQVHLANNPQLKAINDESLRQLMDAYPNESGQFIKNLFEYFSGLCRIGSDNNAYYVLTALFAAFQNYHETNTGFNVDALISPSAASDGLGLNIVMMPNAVDRCLRLHAVCMDRYYLVFPEQQNYFNYQCTEVIINHQKLQNFDYQFKKYIPVAERFIKRHGLL